MLWRSNLNYRVAMLGDGITTLASCALSFLLWHSLQQTFHSPFFGMTVELSSTYYLMAIGSALLWIALFRAERAYAYQRFTSYSTELGIVGRVMLEGVCILLVFTFFSRTAYIPRSLIGIFALVNLFSLSAEKAVVFHAAKVIRARGWDRRTVLVVANRADAQQFVRAIERQFSWGLQIIGIVTNDDDRSITDPGCPIVGKYSEFGEILHKYPVDEVIILAGKASLADIDPVLSTCELEGVAVKIVSDLLGRRAKQIHADIVYEMPILSIEWNVYEEWELAVKRIVDIFVAGTALIVLSPLFLAIAIMIKLTSPGPTFYHWRVVGKNKRPFVGYKFRTMVVNADTIKKELMQRNEMSGPVFKLKNDPRITSVGRYLRKFSLDELPQLYSVLKGDMSLVGPRPPLITEFNEFDPWHRRKLSVKPGITCLWQVSGRNEITDFNTWARLDLQYIDNWSLWLDLKILLKTVPSVLLGKGQ
jgi:exopolysaccharide biosynthesis polyprenyl glycosylphosphotransferase